MIEQRLNLEQTQKLIVTQELRQAITLLTMPLLELQQFIEEQLQENPVLEQEYDCGDTQNEMSELSSAQEKEMDRAVQDLLNRNHENDDGGQEYEGYEWEKIAADWQENFYNKTPVQEQVSFHYEPVEMQYSSLYEYLQFQLNIMTISDEQKRIGRFIIANLGRDGYLLQTPERMAENLGNTVEQVEEVLHLIRSFDPPGIGGVNLQQCLLLQLDPAEKSYEPMKEIIENYLDMVASNRLPLIAKKMHRSVGEIQGLVDHIRSLNPRPGLSFEDGDVVEYIYPDVVIEKVDDDYVVVVNDSSVPKVGISNFYMKLIRDSDSSNEEVKEFVKQKLNSAAWIIKGIEQRRATIYRIAEAVIDLQRDFFDKGPNYLVPLNLSTVAETVGVHESTVSRAISNKYVQSPHGLFPWKFFFVNGVGSGGSLKAAVTNVKGIMKDLIDHEDPANPLNDESLVELLKKQDILISRRTVAKYRKDLGILSAGKRKRY